MERLSESLKRLSAYFLAPLLPSAYAPLASLHFEAQVDLEARLELKAKLVCEALGQATLILSDISKDLRIQFADIASVCRLSHSRFGFTVKAQQFTVKVDKPEDFALWVGRLLYQQRSGKEYAQAREGEIERLLSVDQSTLRESSARTQLLDSLLQFYSKDEEVRYAAAGTLQLRDSDVTPVVEKQALLLVKRTQKGVRLRVVNPVHTVLLDQPFTGERDLRCDQAQGEIILPKGKRFAFDSMEGVATLKRIASDLFCGEQLSAGMQRLSIGVEQHGLVFATSELLGIYQQRHFKLVDGVSRKVVVKTAFDLSFALQVQPVKLQGFNSQVLALCSNMRKGLLLLDLSPQPRVGRKAVSSHVISDFAADQSHVFVYGKNIMKFDRYLQLVSEKSVGNSGFQAMALLQSTVVLLFEDRIRLIPKNFQKKSKLVVLGAGCKGLCGLGDSLLLQFHRRLVRVSEDSLLQVDDLRNASSQEYELEDGPCLYGLSPRGETVIHQGGEISLHSRGGTRPRTSRTGHLQALVPQGQFLFGFDGTNFWPIG